MAKLEELYRYKNYEFSSGCIAGDDYKIFQTKYINYLKSIAKEYGWELVSANRNHYCFSAFIRYQDKYNICLSISDVRYFQNEWLTNILYRTAINEKDYTGGQNQYTNLGNLKYALYGLLNRMGAYGK